MRFEMDNIPSKMKLSLGFILLMISSISFAEKLIVPGSLCKAVSPSLSIALQSRETGLFNSSSNQTLAVVCPLSNRDFVALSGRKGDSVDIAMNAQNSSDTSDPISCSLVQNSAVTEKTNLEPSGTSTADLSISFRWDDVVYSNSENISHAISCSLPPESNLQSIEIKSSASKLYADGFQTYKIRDDAVIETEGYRIENFGMEYVKITERYKGPSCYPDPEDCTDPDAVFQITDPLSSVGDFNRDGLEDIALVIGYSPHKTGRDWNKLSSKPIFFIQTESGDLVLDNSVVEGYEDIIQCSAYRIRVADFNGDGYDDLVTSSFCQAYQEFNGNPNYEIPVADRVNDRPLLLLSNTSGKLQDARDNISLDYANYYGGHEISVGDIDGDGDIDIYTGARVLLNDGSGMFTDETDSWTYFSSNAGGSAIGDINGDGKADLISNYDVLISTRILSGYQYITAFTELKLPDNFWGENGGTTNYMMIADVLSDVPGNEIILAETRWDPYYDGRYFQIYSYQNGKFVSYSERLEGNLSRAGTGTGENIYKSGEGYFKLLDIDNDGLTDIVDITTGCLDCSGGFFGGVDVFKNNGDGTYTLESNDGIPYIARNDIEGFEGSTPEKKSTGLPSAHPIFLGKSSKVSWVSQMSHFEDIWPPEFNTYTFYTIRAK